MTMNQPQGPVCQSCGMPLARDAQGGGTEANGSKSTEYCSHCYRNGAFTSPAMTVEQMVTNVRGRLTQLNLPPAAVAAMSEGVRSLRRWRV
jgi:hypothetical protein